MLGLDVRLLRNAAYDFNAFGEVVGGCLDPNFVNRRDSRMSVRAFERTMEKILRPRGLAPPSEYFGSRARIDALSSYGLGGCAARSTHCLKPQF